MGRCYKMTTIHMDPNQVRSASRHIDVAADQMFNDLQRLYSSIGRLDLGWRGGNSDNFIATFRHMLKQFDNQAAQLQTFSVRISREADEWENADRSDQGFPPGINKVFYPGDGSGGHHAEVQYPGQKGFDWVGWWDSVISIGGEGASHIPYDSVRFISYDGIGRFINTLIGNVHGGWVGRMDDLGHLLRSPAIQKLLPVVGYGFGVWEDFRNGDDWKRAFGSELVDTALNLVPYIAMYNLLLGLGTIIAGGVDAAGYHDQAADAQEFLGKLDFTEKLGDAYYDFVTQHPLSALYAINNPALAFTNPDYVDFVGSFIADNLVDFGATDAAQFVYTGTDFFANMDRDLFQNIMNFSISTH